MNDFLLIRLSSLGDIIHTLPAMACLRRSFPAAKIAWASEPAGKEILDLVPGLDEVIVCPKNIFENRRLLKKKAGTVLDFQGLIKSGLLAFLSGARRRLGFSRPNLKEPFARFFYTETLPPLDEFADHVIIKNLRLLELLEINVNEAKTSLDFPLELPVALRAQVEQKLRVAGLALEPRPIIFNVGGSWPSKRLPPEFWIKLINLAKEGLSSGQNFFLLWGHKDELTLARSVQKETGIALLPFLSIKEVIGLLSFALLVVSGDTFALQAATALNIRSLGLFGPTSPQRNGPIHPQDEVIYAGVECSPCYSRTCAHPRCWEDISVEKVAATLLRQVEKHAPY